MITLTIYPESFGEPSASPFCTKALCMLKTTGLAFQIDESPDPRKAPKQKLPMIEHDGHIIPDSEQIREHIEAAADHDFNAGLSDEQRGVADAVTRMLEEHFYFAVVADRWANDANWAHVKKAFFSDIPALLRPIITRSIRKQALGQLNGQGIGRHSEAERFGRARRDVVSIRTILGDKPFLFGDAPTAADYTAVPMLRASIATPVPTMLSDFIRGEDKIMSYLERGKEALYP
ncbi:MAG: glutathione S-transferase family protein [Henriciella sp.]|jgi:glutathione S-transferase